MKMVDRCIDDGVSFLTAAERDVLRAEFAAQYPDIQAKGYRLVVKPYVRPQKTTGGIILADTSRDEDQFHSLICQVISVGPLAYTDSKFCGGYSWCDVGDWVVIPRTTGTRIPAKDGDVLRVINEDDVCAIVKDPTDWQIRITATKY